MEPENLEEIKKLPQAKEGWWLSDHWIYYGQKFMTEEAALEFRSKTLAEHGVKDPPLGGTKKKASPQVMQDAPSERKSEESERISGLALLLNYIGGFFILAGIVSTISYWPGGGPEMAILKVLVLSNGFGLAVFGIFCLGFAKIISLLSRIEKNTQK